MNSYSIRLACVGAVIGVLTLTAAALGGAGNKTPAAKKTPPASAVSAQAGEGLQELAQTEDRSVSVMLPTVLLALRADPALDWSGLTLCGPEEQDTAAVTLDADGDASLGPLCAGRYSLRKDGVLLGEFVLNENASVAIASGRLWTDGELLYLEKDIPSEAELRLTLTARGYYSFLLESEEGVSRAGAVFIPDTAAWDPGGVFLRTLRFPGLPAGKYRVLCGGRTVAEIVTKRGEVSAVELRLGGD